MAKKKTTAKAVKKSSIKLIEGKYSHKFLTRLNPQEGEKLTDLMKDENLKSFTGAVTLAVMNYKSMKDTIQALNKKVSELQSKNHEIAETITEYIDVSKRLHGLKLGKTKSTISHDEFICSKCKGVFPLDEVGGVAGGKHYCYDCW